MERGRIELDRDVTEWLRLALAPGNVTLAAITPAIASEAARLGRDFQGDPGDRLIVATARVLGGGLVTKDERIRAFRKVDAIW